MLKLLDAAQAERVGGGRDRDRPSSAGGDQNQECQPPDLPKRRGSPPGWSKTQGATWPPRGRDVLVIQRAAFPGVTAERQTTLKARLLGARCRLPDGCRDLVLSIAALFFVMRRYEREIDRIVSQHKMRLSRRRDP